MFWKEDVNHATCTLCIFLKPYHFSRHFSSWTIIAFLFLISFVMFLFFSLSAWNERKWSAERKAFRISGGCSWGKVRNSACLMTKVWCHIYEMRAYPVGSWKIQKKKKIRFRIGTPPSRHNGEFLNLADLLFSYAFVYLIFEILWNPDLIL